MGKKCCGEMIDVDCIPLSPDTANAIIIDQDGLFIPLAVAPQARIQLVPQMEPPANPGNGTIYFDDVLFKLRVYAGGWVDLH